MALLNCPECGKEISEFAKVCPNCGIKIRKSKKKIILLIFSIVLLAAVFIGLFFVMKIKKEKMKVYEDSIVSACEALGEKNNVFPYSLNIRECRVKTVTNKETSKENIYVYFWYQLDREPDEYQKALYVCDNKGKQIKNGDIHEAGPIKSEGSKVGFSSRFLEFFEGLRNPVIDISELSDISDWKSFDSKEIEKIISE